MRREQVYAAVLARDLYVLPNFTGDVSRAQAQAIAMGRVTATDPYPALIAPWLQ